jgi:hypothetical protein
MRINKKMATQLTGLVLVGSFLTLTGCATMGANMALSIAKDEEAKGCEASYPGNNTKVKLEDCERISRLIKKAGVPGGFVGYDKSGRLKLKGSYINEDQIDLAYMTALTVVGTSSMDISPVTPRDLQEIKMVKSYVPQQNSSGKGEKYALLIGISKFQQKISPIKTAVKDAESIKETLIRNSGFKDENITLIKDEQATKSNILNALRELEAKVTPNDSVVFYISTHGSPPNTFGKMGVIPYDIKSDFKTEDVQALADQLKTENDDGKIIQIVKQRIAALKTAVAFDDLQNFITSIKTNKFVAILDTCYSGAALGALSYPVGGAKYVELEKNYSQSLNAENKSELVGSGKVCKVDQKSSYGNALVGLRKHIDNCDAHSGSKGLVLDSANDSTAEKSVISVAKKSGGYNYDSMENLRTAFGVPTEPRHGKVILTATSNNEQSLFDPTIFDNSYFTYYLTKGLQRSKGQILPAFDYAQVRTRKLVDSTESCRTQTPEMISTPDECINVDLSK